MRSTIFAAVSALALGVSAAPSLTTRQNASPCMDDAAASKVAGNFQQLIGAPFSTPLAQAALTEDFVDYSDSVIELINQGNSPNSSCYVVPLGSKAFDSRAAFIAGQSSQAPITFNILKVWHSCDTVFLHWRTPNPGTISGKQQIVTGLIVLEAESQDSDDQPFAISGVYSEFNSGAWLVDIGNFTPTCDANGNGPPPPSKRSVPLLRM